MKGQIVYIKGHEKSEKQAQQAFTSLRKRGWDVELKAGITPKTVKDDVRIIEESRLLNFKKENRNRYLTKVSCALNHIEFFKNVVETDEPMAFFEHDAISVMAPEEYEFEDYLLLNAEYVFRPPNKLAINQFKDYVWPSFGVCDFPENYPLLYYRNNIWKNSMMAPGTGAYAITPQGAQKMLDAIDEHGLDQSDFMINSSNLEMQYINPSPVKFNNVNLSTSYGI